VRDEALGSKTMMQGIPSPFGRGKTIEDLLLEDPEERRKRAEIAVEVYKICIRKRTRKERDKIGIDRWLKVLTIFVSQS
jgi:hypothetical protein